VLERGYAIVTAADGEIVTNAARLQVGQVVALTLARGGANASVTATQGATSDGDAR
jgi:exonuclease VII large subunit